MLASVATFALEGVDSREVTVEVDVRPGLPVFTVVGLPDAAVREARERVRAAILNSGLQFPQQRLTANLAPADVRKAGPGFDLALALSVLVASGQLPSDEFTRCAAVGELSLSGAPHHTISPSGLIGGGSTPRPGEITLAHRGVLFLDELAEFARPTLEALRQPLEEGRVEVMRGQRSIGFPAAVMLVGACNACPCGRPQADCVCDT